VPEFNSNMVLHGLPSKMPLIFSFASSYDIIAAAAAAVAVFVMIGEKSN
jgi:hypothetical protein